MPLKRIMPYAATALSLFVLAWAISLDGNTPEPSSYAAAELPALPTSEPTPQHAALAALPTGIVGYYAPGGATAGALPADAPYQIIGRYGYGWLLLRLPGRGEYWTPTAALAGIEMSALHNYQEVAP